MMQRGGRPAGSAVKWRGCQRLGPPGSNPSARAFLLCPTLALNPLAGPHTPLPTCPPHPSLPAPHIPLCPLHASSQSNRAPRTEVEARLANAVAEATNAAAAAADAAARAATACIIQRP